jgi:hypothetical protein
MMVVMLVFHLLAAGQLRAHKAQLRWPCRI